MLKWLKKDKSGIIKRMIYLNKYSSTTKIFLELDLEPNDYFIKMKKLKFYKQLCSHEISRVIILEEIQNPNNTSKESFVPELVSTISQNQSTSSTRLKTLAQ